MEHKESRGSFLNMNPLILNPKHHIKGAACTRHRQGHLCEEWKQGRDEVRIKQSRAVMK
jgi:hypothetical protein